MTGTVVKGQADLPALTGQLNVPFLGPPNNLVSTPDVYNKLLLLTRRRASQSSRLFYYSCIGSLTGLLFSS
jgi:hypothetical protein